MKIFDIARTFYNQSPKAIQNLANPLLAHLPVRYRYGKSYLDTYFDIERSSTDAEFTRDYQIKALKKLILSAHDKSPFWRERLEKIAGLIDEDSTDFPWEEYENLAVLTKDEIRSHAEEMLVVPINNVDVVSTSGSSGTPLKLYVDKDRSVREFAFVNQVWAKSGFTPNDTRFILRGVNIKNVDNKPWEYNSALRELRASPFHLIPKHMDTYLSLIDKYGAQYIHGYPSAIFIFAQHILRNDWKPKKPIKGLFPISESLHKNQIDIIRQAFPDASILPFYGMSEKVALAGANINDIDCYDFEPLYGYTELLDENNKPITKIGQKGRIVSTGFISRSMPLFRYDSADEAELVELACPQNSYRLRVKYIHSRWAQEFIISNSGALISMSALNLHSKVYAKIQEFQFFQDAIGKATLKVVLLPETSAKEIEPLMQEISNKVGSGVEFTLKIVDEIKQNSRGKRPFIDQKLDLEQYRN